jgi:hypothetical protein
MVGEKKNKNKLKSKLPIPAEKVDEIAKFLTKRIIEEERERRFLGAKKILALVAGGVFSFLDWYPKNWAYLEDPEAYGVTKRFNIPYLKRILRRLEKQKLIKVKEEKGKQIVKITDAGRTRVLKYAIEEIKIKEPIKWDGRWWLVSYDLPEEMAHLRSLIRRYFLSWGFCPIHKSVYLHAYPCGDEIEFLREYFGVGEYIKVFKVEKIENDKVFREFFDI